MPITSPKFYCMGSWTDIKEPIDYINKKLERPMYLFATSLGGIISAQYLINDQNKTSIKAATFFGTPLSTADNCEFLDNSAYGFNNYIMGKNLISKFRPMFKPVNVLSSPEQRDSYQKLLSGEVQPSLNTFDDFCASPMFGYRNRSDYR